MAANIKVSPKEGNVNTEFKFEGVKSRSDDGAIKAYNWEIRDKDGKMIMDSDDQSFSTRFNKPGIYNVSLVVTDITGAKDQGIISVKVTSREPIANFTFNIPEKNHPNKIGKKKAETKYIAKIKADIKLHDIMLSALKKQIDWRDRAEAENKERLKYNIKEVFIPAFAISLSTIPRYALAQ